MLNLVSAAPTAAIRMVMHTHGCSWGPLWTWDWCCVSSFHIHNLRKENIPFHSKRQINFAIFHMLASLAPDQEDQCCQVIQVLLGDQGSLKAQKDHGLLSPRHGPEKHMLFTTEIHPTHFLPLSL